MEDREVKEQLYLGVRRGPYKTGMLSLFKNIAMGRKLHLDHSQLT